MQFRGHTLIAPPHAVGSKRSKMGVLGVSSFCTSGGQNDLKLTKHVPIIILVIPCEFGEFSMSGSDFRIFRPFWGAF